MEDHEIISKYFPPRAIDSITTGFQIAAKHVYLLLFPLFVDLFLWLGPKIRIRELFLGMYQNFVEIWSSFLNEAANTLLTGTYQSNLEVFLENFNLFSSATTFPLGIPSLLGTVSSLNTPFVANRISEVGTIWEFASLWLGLVIIGITLGCIFFHEIAATVIVDQKGEKEPSSLPKQMLDAFLYMLVLTVATGIVITILVIFTSLISVISSGMAQLVLIAGFVMITWLAIPLMFGAHSIFLYNQPFYKSILSGYQIMNLSFRYQVSQKEALFILPKSVSFVLLVYILYEGLNLVWKIPATSSSLLLIGILGHAFIATALLISSFHYFSQMKLWQETIKTAQKQVSVFNR